MKISMNLDIEMIKRIKSTVSSSKSELPWPDHLVPTQVVVAGAMTSIQKADIQLSRADVDHSLVALLDKAWKAFVTLSDWEWKS